MATTDEAYQALIDAIAAMAPQLKRASSILELAEALAWLRAPGQSHGGSTTVTK